MGQNSAPDTSGLSQLAQDAGTSFDSGDGPSKMGQFGKKALKGGLMGGAQGLQQQGQGQQRGGGSMPQYIQGAMLPQIPGQSQQQVMPYGVNNPFFGG